MRIHVLVLSSGINEVKNAIVKNRKTKFFISRNDESIYEFIFHTGMLIVIDIVQTFCMETHERGLTFPQRNWLLLCFLTAIIVAVAYYLIDTNTRHNSAQQNEIQTTS